MKKLIEYFDYKDWWNWVFYGILTYAVIGLIYTIPTWVRWKWGYFSIDSIAYIIILGLLGYVNQLILNERILKRLRRLENGSKK